MVCGGHIVQIKDDTLEWGTEIGERRLHRVAHQMTHSCRPAYPLYSFYDRAIKKYRTRYWKWPGQYNNGRKFTTLTRVCRQLHQETTLMMLELNLFTFHDSPLGKRWLNSLMKVQRSAIKQIVLEDFKKHAWMRKLKAFCNILAGIPKVYLLDKGKMRLATPKEMKWISKRRLHRNHS
jgi:hypothetical protein